MGGQASAASATAGRASPFCSSPFSSPSFGWRGAGDYCKKLCRGGDKCQCTAAADEQCMGDATCAQNLVTFKAGAVLAPMMCIIMILIDVTVTL